MTTKAIKAFIAMALVGFLSACSVHQTLTIKADNSGIAVLRIETAKTFREYMLSLAEVAGTSDPANKGKIFDAKGIEKDLAKRPGITVRKVASPSLDVLDIDLAFSSLEAVYSGNKDVTSTGIISLTEADGKKILKFHVDRKNFSQLKAAFPGMNDAIFEGLAPQENDKTTDAEYMEMMKFSLGDEGPALLKKSFITLTVKPEGEIVSQSGGAIADGGVTFKIPLIRLLILDKPLDYSVSWK